MFTGYWAEEKRALAAYHAKKRKRAFVEQFCVHNYDRDFTIEALAMKGSEIYGVIDKFFEEAK